MTPACETALLHMLRTGGWTADDPVKIRTATLRSLARKAMINIETRKPNGIVAATLTEHGRKAALQVAAPHLRLVQP